jgi:hypothetical protein
MTQVSPQRKTREPSPATPPGNTDKKVMNDVHTLRVETLRNEPVGGAVTTSSSRPSQTAARTAALVLFGVFCSAGGCAVSRTETPSKVEARVNEAPSTSGKTADQLVGKVDDHPASARLQSPPEGRGFGGGPIGRLGVIDAMSDVSDALAADGAGPGRKRLISMLARARQREENGRDGEGGAGTPGVLCGKAGAEDPTANGVRLAGWDLASTPAGAKEGSRARDRAEVRLRILAQGAETPDETPPEEIEPIQDEPAPVVARRQKPEAEGEAGESGVPRIQLVVGRATAPQWMGDAGPGLFGDDRVSTAKLLQPPGVGNAAGQARVAESAPGATDAPERLLEKDLRCVRADISVGEAKVPEDAPGKTFLPMGDPPAGVVAARGWPGFLYQWEAPSVRYRPLYFEEVNLERYGYSRRPRCQSVVSGARFFATVPMLPYRMMAEPPREGVYPLGHYRPGSCVPSQVHRMPLSVEGGLVEAGVITGLIFAIP